VDHPGGEPQDLALELTQRLESQRIEGGNVAVAPVVNFKCGNERCPENSNRSWPLREASNGSYIASGSLTIDHRAETGTACGDKHLLAGPPRRHQTA
jgi:hypothetical protein